MGAPVGSPGFGKVTRLWQGLRTLPPGRPKVSIRGPEGDLRSARRRGRETRAERDRNMYVIRLMIGTVVSVALLHTVVSASAEVTLKGNVLCNRATEARPWNWDPKDGDHTPILYAIEGTPELA